MAEKGQAQESRSPFKPGAGTVPPCLTGRETELGVFRHCWKKAQDGKGDGVLVLFGPRGTGKTVLLRTMERMALKEAPRDFLRRRKVLVRRISPSSVPTGDALAQALDQAFSSDLSRSEVDVQGAVDVAGAKLGGAVRKGQSAAAASVCAALERLARKTPLLVTVDEAHTLTKDAGAALLQGEQDARSAGAKVQIMLAGTPDLKDRLGGMGVSFWDRLDERLRHMNLLGRDDAAAAVEAPFQSEKGVSLDEDAKDRIFELTSGYPYFLQVMGRVLWDRHDGGAKTITRRVVDAVEQEFLDGKNAYYHNRFNELDEAGMVGPAFAVATACRHMRGSDFGKSELRDAARLGATLAIDDEDVRDELNTGRDMARFLLHKGFMWGRDPTSGKLEPGIPTLVDFVRERVLAKHPDAEERLLKDVRFKRVLNPSNNSPTP